MHRKQDWFPALSFHYSIMLTFRFKIPTDKSLDKYIYVNIAIFNNNNNKIIIIIISTLYLYLLVSKYKFV